jgi:hypothetical protein
MGLLARFFNGGLSISDMKEMEWYEIEEWHKICVLQDTEEEVVQELSYDENGKKRTLPNGFEIRKKVLERIEERRKKAEKWQDQDFQSKQ